MSGPGDRFGRDTTRLEEVRHVESTDYIDEYIGMLAATGERVRISTLAPEVADIEAAVDAFTHVSDGWYNASANANIRPVLDLDTTPRPWIAVPADSGETLAAARPALGPDAIETVITETADAVRTLGLYNTVHGNISPTAIWVANTAETPTDPTVQVGGFGLEQAVRAAIGAHEPTAYTAPELLEAPDQQTEQTDVYGLGAVTYFALTGQPPVTGADLPQAIRDGPTEPPSAYVDGIATELDDVVMRALSRRPADRYDSAYAFHRAFLSVFDPAELTTDEDTGDEPEPAPTDETPEANSGERADDDETATANSDGQTDDEQTDTETTIDQDRGGSATRRAAMGVLGLGLAGGAGAFFLRNELFGTGTTGQPANEPRAQSTTGTERSRPSITGFTLSNPSGQQLRTSFESDEQLTTIRLRISGPETRVLTTSEFTERQPDGTYTYEAAYQAQADGTYVATLQEATDLNGDDWASGQQERISVETAADALSIQFNDPSSLDEWENTHPELELTQQPAYEGQHSASIATGDVGTVAQIEPFDRNRQLRRVTYYWHEASGSFGGGVALETQSGELEVFTGSNNPEWTVINGFDDDRRTVYEGDGYDRWIQTDLSFDWSSGTVTAAFTDLRTERTESLTVELASGTGIGRIRLVGFTSARYPDDGFYTGSCHMRWDTIQLLL